MLCAKCQRNEATVHLTTISHAKGEETIHLCIDCGPEFTRVPALDSSKLAVLPVIASKCEFCGTDAFSGKLLANDRWIYWCFDCQAEYRRIFAGLLQAEFAETIKIRNSFLPFVSPQQFEAWSADAGQKVVEIMKSRHQGNDRDVAS